MSSLRLVPFTPTLKDRDPSSRRSQDILLLCLTATFPQGFRPRKLCEYGRADRLVSERSSCEGTFQSLHLHVEGNPYNHGSAGLLSLKHRYYLIHSLRIQSHLWAFSLTVCLSEVL